MYSERATVFNKQDEILCETQGVLTGAVAALSGLIDQLPPETQSITLAVLSQLADTSETISDLRAATVELNNSVTRLSSKSGYYNLDEAERTQIMIEAQKEGFYGNPSEYYAQKYA